MRHCRDMSWLELGTMGVLCERAKCRHGGVFGGGEEVVHELVPVAVGVEHERDEVGAFFLGEEGVLVLLRVDQR